MKFKDIILNTFKDIISEFNFSVETDYNKVFEEVQFYNDNCILRFTSDMGYILCDFADPAEKSIIDKNEKKPGVIHKYNFYPLFSVWKFLYQNDTESFDCKGVDIKDQPLIIKRLILDRFKNILNGDFSWTTAYKINDTRLSNKIEYMMTHWDIDNPVRIKFNKGNSDWEKAFDDYKTYLDNLLR